MTVHKQALGQTNEKAKSKRTEPVHKQDTGRTSGAKRLRDKSRKQNKIRAIPAPGDPHGLQNKRAAYSIASYAALTSSIFSSAFASFFSYMDTKSVFFCCIIVMTISL